MIDQANRAGWTDGGHNGRNRGTDGLNDYVTESATWLPGLALNPRSFIVNSAMQQAFEILKGLERRVNRNRDGNRVLNARQHGSPSHTRRRLCPDSQRKTRANIRQCRCSKIMSPPNCNETLSPSQD